ncbi:MAG: alpha/beta fold hydrolase [Acidimicrobiales bacterium]|nr:alpha/beta fold hydrolase [Acidimicrobiales bacterium]
MVAVLAEIGLYHSYRGHDARFHWFTHFFVGATVVLLIGSVYAWRTHRPIRLPLLWILGAHVYAMFPDFLVQAGVAHYRWMDLFLGHISTHFVPGRNLTWFLVAAVALAVHLVTLDRLPPRDGYGPLHVDTTGAGAPVVLVHGLGASSRYWEPVIDHLAQSHRTIAVDLLGFGRSPKPGTASYDIGCHVDALAPHVPAGSVVVAHSTGASIALRLATRHPDRVAGLVLVAPPAHPDSSAARAQISELGTFARLTAHQRLMARVLCETMCMLRPLAAAGAPVILRDVPARVAIDGALHTWPSYSRTLQRVVIDHRIDDDLRTVAVPTRILIGAKDTVATVANVRSALDRTGRDDIVVIVVEDEDHHLALHRPEFVVDAVGELSGETSLGTET